MNNNFFSEIAKIYERLDITVTERGESFYQERMKVLVKELEEKGKIFIIIIIVLLGYPVD